MFLCVVFEYVTVELFFKKKKVVSCVFTQIYFALLAFTQDFVWCWGYIIKQIFNANFCLISKLLTLSKIIFNDVTYLGWIISDTKQKGMEYLLIIAIIIAIILLAINGTKYSGINQVKFFNRLSPTNFTCPFLNTLSKMMIDITVLRTLLFAFRMSFHQLIRIQIIIINAAHQKFHCTM